MKKSNTEQEETPSVEEESPALEGESLEEAIANLSPEQAEMFMRALSLTMRKRRLMLVGNLTALLIMIIGMFFAFAAYANRQPGAFAAWVFLVPFGSAGFVLWLFGKLAKHAGEKTHKTLVQPITNSPETSP